MADLVDGALRVRAGFRLALSLGFLAVLLVGSVHALEERAWVEVGVLAVLLMLLVRAAHRFYRRARGTQPPPAAGAVWEQDQVG